MPAERLPRILGGSRAPFSVHRIDQLLAKLDPSLFGYFRLAFQQKSRALLDLCAMRADHAAGQDDEHQPGVDEQSQPDDERRWSVHRDYACGDEHRGHRDDPYVTRAKYPHHPEAARDVERLPYTA